MCVHVYASVCYAKLVSNRNFVYTCSHFTVIGYVYNLLTLRAHAMTGFPVMTFNCRFATPSSIGITLRCVCIQYTGFALHNIAVLTM